MRIHSGSARGRVLKTRDGKGTRPTEARARETLFKLEEHQALKGTRPTEARAASGELAGGAEELDLPARFQAFTEEIS